MNAYCIYPSRDDDAELIARTGSLVEALRLVAHHRNGLQREIRLLDGSWYEWPTLKLYCIVSREALGKMGGNRGKMMAQSGHAFTHAWWDAERRFPEDAYAYQASQHAYKITLAVDTEEDLVRLQDAYMGVCGVSLVRDAGFTVFKEPTTTCLGIGPISPERIGDDLKVLRPLQ